MKKTPYFLFTVMLIGCCSWFMRPDNELKTAGWLLGTWKNTTSRGVIYETWKQEDEHEFRGKSYLVKQNDTVVFERIRLLQEENQLYYIPTVNGQNNNQPVRFALKKQTERELVFENPEHDFPQLITYTRITEDSLVAEISGVKNGATRKHIFPMKRVN